MNKFTLPKHAEVVYCHNGVEITHKLTEGLDAYAYTAMLVVTQNAEILELKERLAMHEREGYKLVPLEPTDEMINTYRDKSIAPISTLSVIGYKAMIGAGE